MEWKGYVDEVSENFDGGKIPCILIENKADLLKDYNEGIIELEEFALKNGFCGAFRTSCKTGLNVNASMDFLINNIVERTPFLRNFTNHWENALYKYINI